MKGKSGKCPPKSAPKSAVKGRRMTEGGKLDELESARTFGQAVPEQARA